MLIYMDIQSTSKHHNAFFIFHLGLGHDKVCVNLFSHISHGIEIVDRVWHAIVQLLVLDDHRGDGWSSVPGNYLPGGL